MKMQIKVSIMSMLLPLLIGLGQPAIAQAESSSGTLLAAAGLAGPQAAPLSYEQQIEELSAQTGLSLVALKRMPDLVQFLIANDLGSTIQRNGQKIILAKYGIPMLLVNGKRYSWEYVKKHIPVDETGRMINHTYSPQGIIQIGTSSPTGGPSNSKPHSGGGLGAPDHVAYDRAGIEDEWKDRWKKFQAENPNPQSEDKCVATAYLNKFVVVFFYENEPKTHYDEKGREVFATKLKDRVLYYLEKLFKLNPGFSLSAVHQSMIDWNKRLKILFPDGSPLPNDCANQLSEIHTVLISAYHLATVALQMGWIENQGTGEAFVDTNIKPNFEPPVTQGASQDAICQQNNTLLQRLKTFNPWLGKQISIQLEAPHTSTTHTGIQPMKDEPSAKILMQSIIIELGLKNGTVEFAWSSIDVEIEPARENGETTDPNTGETVPIIEPAITGKMRVLQVTKAPFTLAELKKAVRKQQLILHPDKTKNYLEPCKSQLIEMNRVLSELQQAAEQMGLQ